MPRGSTPEARRARNIKAWAWDRENTTQVKLKLNNHTDEDILQVLQEQPSVQGYIKRLIRQDINADTLEARGDMELEYYRIKPEFLPAWGGGTNAALDPGDIESLAEQMGRPAAELMEEVEPVRAFWSWVLVTWTRDSATAERIDARNAEDARKVLEERCRSARPAGFTRIAVEYAPVVAEEIAGYPRMELDGVPYWVDEDHPRMISQERILAAEPAER